MGTPDCISLTPIASDFALFHAVAITDDIVIGDGIDGISGLPLPMHPLQKFDTAEVPGAVVDDDIFPPVGPIESACTQETS